MYYHPPVLKSVLKKSSVLAAATGVAGVIGLAVRASFARNLTPEDFGLGYALLQFGAVLGMLKALGVNRALQQRIPVHASKGRNGAIKTATIGAALVSGGTAIAAAVIAVILAGPIAGGFFHQPGRPDLVYRVAVLLVVGSLNNTLYAVFYAYRLPGPIGLRQIEQRAVILLGSLIIARGRPEAIVECNIAGEAVVLATGLIALRRTPFPFGASLEAIRPHTLDLLGFGARALFGSVLGKLLGRIEVLFLTGMGAFTGVAYYEVALFVARMVVKAGSLVNQMLFPEVASMHGKGDGALVEKDIFRLRIIILGGSAAMTAALALLASPILTLLFGPDYAAAAPALVVLTAASGIHALTVLHVGALSGLDRPGRGSFVTLGIGLVNLVCDIIWIPEHGFRGAVAATTVSYIAGFVLSWILLGRAMARIRESGGREEEEEKG